MNSANRGEKQVGDTTYCNFTVGQHVVCVIAPTKDLVLNRVYTVREILLWAGSWVNPKTGVTVGYKDEEKVCVRLQEVRQRHTAYGVPYVTNPDAPFYVGLFRPLQKLKVEDFMSAPVDRERVSA